MLLLCVVSFVTGCTGRHSERLLVSRLYYFLNRCASEYSNNGMANCLSVITV